MNMSGKLTVALIVSAISTMAIAAKDTRYATASATGTFTVSTGCSIDLSLSTPDKTVTLSDAKKNNTVISEYTVTQECPGKIWIQASERDSTGMGVMTNGSEKANYGIHVAGNSGLKWDSNTQTAVSLTSLPAGKTFKGWIGTTGMGDYGYAKVGAYKYTLESGYWID
ncbi:hypothetical protein AB9P61_004267 [Escherichia coli]